MPNVFRKSELARLPALALAASTLVLPTFDSTTAGETNLRRFESVVGQPAMQAFELSGPIPTCGPRYDYGSNDCGTMTGGPSGGPDQ